MEKYGESYRYPCISYQERASTGRAGSGFGCVVATNSFTETTGPLLNLFPSIPGVQGVANATRIIEWSCTQFFVYLGVWYTLSS